MPLMSYLWRDPSQDWRRGRTVVEKEKLRSFRHGLGQSGGCCHRLLAVLANAGGMGQHSEMDQEGPDGDTSLQRIWGATGEKRLKTQSHPETAPFAHQ